MPPDHENARRPLGAAGAENVAIGQRFDSKAQAFFTSA